MKNNITKSLLVIVFVVLCSLKGLAAEPGTFVIVDNGTATDINPYHNALSGADMESFRYQNKRCTIEFDNGLKVELLSAQEMYLMGLPVVVSDYKTENTANWIQPVFHLNADGTLSAMYTKPDLKQRTTTH